MRIIDPQSAVLTNIEVLAYITANPPRRPPNPPPNSRNWVPSPDLRDHNTVVREIHNYIHRLSPHLLKYPAYIHGEPPQSQQQPSSGESPTVPPVQPSTPTPMDLALRELVTRLKPFGLTKGEVIMIVNLGVGLDTSSAGARADGEEGEGGEQDGMEVDEVEGGNEGGEEAGMESGGGGLSEEDYGALALLDTVIEEREERLSEDDVAQILAIIRETLGPGSKGIMGSVG
ncbi:hypothetical protein KXX16_001762 [Aspergillus fumigatus]|uniref:DNA-directed RNA polymerase III subunit RPC9 n=3 Tax=Aspergillus fumigatus TaxID=746128 RepID=Q4WYL0_ASPFU|nr:conserved hypothetical protein [Aspergillus fumigatus Af293]EDP52414.1 conserved hypothetical protein [Aspergillus fumigatus A1163]KAH1280289.1 hypothetical protein KXX45_000018 [Aspergillus fumigatus]KMK60023.1 hypothetical protein Y699_01224 [Aspergillus fumigatus Z5]EAL92243.1 conserved hypothetical protein [Aspergillus fumigatus Af293]KAH1284197.1 hypothetical protein KXX30_001169 [Aspergillus fumigatus]